MAMTRDKSLPHTEVFRHTYVWAFGSCTTTIRVTSKRAIGSGTKTLAS